MIKVYSAPDDIKIPKWNSKESRDYNLNKEDEYRDKLKRFLILRNPNCKEVGEVISFPVADGYAEYMVAGLKPAELVHIPLCDAYHFEYVSRLTIKDIKDKIKQRKALKSLFSSK